MKYIITFVANIPIMASKRFTFYLDESIVTDFQNIAHWSRKSQSLILNKLLSDHNEAWKGDKENKQYVDKGAIKPRPEGE